VADDMRKTLGVARDRVEVINNPVVHDRVAAQAKAPFEHEWIGGPEPLIVAAGRLEPQKNYPNLLRAFAMLRQTRPAKLMVLGKGGELDRLTALARELGVAEHVCFYGFCANPYAVMARADVFVLSSDWEGSPNVLVEAMFCGAPVVSTDCPSGPRETLDGGVFGPLVPMNDPEALSGALARTLDNPLPSEVTQARALEWSAKTSAAAYRKVLLPGWPAMAAEVAEV
jgi:glycosyltransferase involved in cell wall biosynthesis